VHAAAAALAAQAENRASARVLGGFPSGWRNVGGTAQRVGYAVGEQTFEITYVFRRPGLELAVNGEPLPVRLLRATPDTVELEVGGVRRTYTVQRVPGWSYVDGPDGSAALAEVPRFADPNAAAHPGSLLAPMPGGVVRVLAGPGDAVTAGQPLVVLEAMKMEHTVAAPVDGIVAEMSVRPGAQVDSGQVLAVVEAPGADVRR
jgi:biotin carboxyl carrier protein